MEVVDDHPILQNINHRPNLLLKFDLLLVFHLNENLAFRLLFYDNLPFRGKTTQFTKCFNFGWDTALSTLISPGWRQGFLVTTTFPSIISRFPWF